MAAAEFVAAFYEVLFSGKAVSAAVGAGWHRLFQNKLRPRPIPALEQRWRRCTGIPLPQSIRETAEQIPLNASDNNVPLHQDERKEQ